MGNTSAGNVGPDNMGKTDKNRGSKVDLGYSKGSRQTGKVSGGVSSKPNSNTVDGNKRMANDSRLAK